MYSNYSYFMLTTNLDVSYVLGFSSSSGIKPLPGMLSFVCVCLSACQVNVFFCGGIYGQ